MLGLKRTSVISDECSSSVVFGFKVSVNHNTACIFKSKVVNAIVHHLMYLLLLQLRSKKVFTFLSWPPLASSFPSDEKWQQITLLALALAELTSVNANPKITSSLNQTHPNG